MTKRDLDRLAAELLEVKPPEERMAELNGWAKAVVAVANAAHATMGLTLTGNRRFQRDRFYASAGLSLKVVV